MISELWRERDSCYVKRLLKHTWCFNIVILQIIVIVALKIFYLRLHRTQLKYKCTSFKIPITLRLLSRSTEHSNSSFLVYLKIPFFPFKKKCHPQSLLISCCWHNLNLSVNKVYFLIITMYNTFRWLVLGQSTNYI